MGSQAAKIFFFIDLLKKNVDVKKSDLKAAVEELRHLLRSQDSLLQGNVPIDGMTIETVQMPPITKQLRTVLLQSDLDLDRVLSKAVKVVWATDLTTSEQSEVSPYFVSPYWKDSQSLQSILDDTFKPLKPPISLASSRIRRIKLSARYLCEHAGIELQWTKQLPDHLHLDFHNDRKRLRVFELPCLLETTKELPWAEETTLSEALRGGMFQPTFIIEFLMTYTILFPPTDRHWLDSIIASRRQWPRWWKRTMSRDERLSAAFDEQIEELRRPSFDKYRTPIGNMSDLFTLYPHWAARLQLLYEEAEDPTPTSAVGRWAERRKGPRHTYWVTVAAFGLAIFFGLTGTIVGVLQLWVSYCQWQVPEGGYGCGHRQ